MSAHDAIAALSMFFAGLILLIPHRIGMSRVNYVIKRYNLPISRAGLLLYKYHNNIELSLLCGTFPMVVIVCLIAAYDDNPNNKKPIRILMIIFLTLMLLSSIIMFIIYVSGGDFGHLNAFYFSLIFLTFFDGFANACAFAINAKFSSLLSAGIPLSGLLVTLLHYMYKSHSDKHHLEDFDYIVLKLQLQGNIIIIFICLGLWVVDLILTWPSPGKLSEGNPGNLFNPANNSNTNHTHDWVPIGMLAISLGTVYAFYPSIAPYSIIDFQYASVIELWILVISALLPFVIAILDLITLIYMIKSPTTAKAFGPSGLIIFAVQNSYSPSDGQACPSPSTEFRKAIKFNWVPINSPSGTVYYLWNYVWICAIPYIFCIQIFMSLLHYPECILSSFFNNNPYFIVFISILFNTLREVLQACGFAGAGKQVAKNTNSYTLDNSITCASSNHTPFCKAHGNKFLKWSTNAPGDGDNTQVDGVIAPCNKLITLFVMMFCVFTGDGYLQHYRRCCRDCWPTTGYTKYQSFFYWLYFGFKGGIKSITSSFTDLYYHNLRPQFISYA